MIKTKSIYKPVEEEEDGLRVLITRWYPRGVKREKYDIWMRELAPSAELLKKYKNSEIKWTDFSKNLLSELRNNADSIEAINTLHAKGSLENITLLCHEKDGEPCHRHMIKNLIDKPKLLESSFVSENTSDQKPVPAEIHVSNEECLFVP